MSARPAILFSANPRAIAVIGDPRNGNIKEHEKLISKNGSVNWNLIRNFQRDDDLEDYYSRIKKGYIYYVPDGHVTYDCNIRWIKRKDELTPQEHKFTPYWRAPSPSSAWITLNITKFIRREPQDRLTCKDVKSFSTGKNFKRRYVINYHIVEEL
jgi:hypothetical protein